MNRFTLLLVLLSFVPLSGYTQSKKTILNQALLVYKTEPHPALYFHTLDSTPLEAKASSASGYFIPVEEKNEVNLIFKNTLNRIIVQKKGESKSYTADTVRLYQSDLTFDESKASLVRMWVNRSLENPKNLLKQMKRLRVAYTLTDTVIDAKRAYTFTVKYPDKEDPIIGCLISQSSWYCILDSSTSRIVEIGSRGLLCGDPYLNTTTIRYPANEELKEQLKLKDELLNNSPKSTFKRKARKELSLKIGDTIPVFTIQKLNGDTIWLPNMNADYLVLDFWYTSCGPCVRSIPLNSKLDSAIQKYNARVIGITTHHQDNDFLERFAAKKGISYPLYLAKANELQDVLGISAYPTIIVVDKYGKILSLDEGHDGSYDAKTEELIKASPKL